jgi:lysozyme
MKTGNDGLNLIKEFEGLHDGDLSQVGLQPKMCPAQIWTEGWGRAMRDDRGNFIKGAANKNLAYSRITIRTKQDADKALVEDLRVFERIVSFKIKVPLTQNQFDALVSYTYNTGGSDTLFKLINRKAPEEQIRKWFETKYITANGVKLAGLVRRRKEESNLFFK